MGKETYTVGNSDISVYIEQVGNLEALKALAGIPKLSKKALNRAILRATQSGIQMAQKELRQEYILPAATFKSYTQTKRHYISTGDGTAVILNFHGYHIPLMQFDVSVNRRGGVSARVKRTNAKEALDDAFSATMKYGSGVFERTGAARFPVRGLYGPSVPQMLSYNEELTERVMKKISDKLDERLDHEIMALLNGWST